MYKTSLKEPITLIILLMICKGYLSLISVTENNGLFNPFFFPENNKVQ